MKTRRTVLSCFAAAALFLCSSCGVEKPADSASENTPEAAEEVLSFDISELPLYEALALSASEKVSILDAAGDLLLLNRYSDYTQDEAQFREEGYNSVTRALEIYDLGEGKIILSFALPDGAFCTDAAFLREQEFVYVTVVSKEAFPLEFHVEVYKDAVVTPIALGRCFETGYDTPEVEALNDGYFAYSYYDFEIGAFGVNIASAPGGVVPQVSLTSDSAEHLRTTLCGNGSEYIYYAAVNGKSTVFVGDAQKLAHQFSLPDTERVYDFCFLRDQILFTMEKSEGASVSKELVVKDLAGNTLLEQSCDAPYRLKSNGADTVLGIDGNYGAYVLRVSSQGISVQKIDTPASPVRFTCLDAETFLLNHYRDRDDAPQLLRLRVQE